MVSLVGDEMSALRKCVQELVRREAVRVGSVPRARASLAYRHRMTPGAWENASKGRNKRVDSRLLQALMAETQKEVTAMLHRIQMLRQMGAEMGEIIEAQSQLVEIRKMLEGV